MLELDFLKNFVILKIFKIKKKILFLKRIILYYYNIDI